MSEMRIATLELLVTGIPSTAEVGGDSGGILPSLLSGKFAESLRVVLLVYAYALLPGVLGAPRA